jgi:hypothetical protein
MISQFVPTDRLQDALFEHNSRDFEKNVRHAVHWKNSGTTRQFNIPMGMVIDFYNKSFSFHFSYSEPIEQKWTRLQLSTVLESCCPQIIQVYSRDQTFVAYVQEPDWTEFMIDELLSVATIETPLALYNLLGRFFLLCVNFELICR